MKDNLQQYFLISMGLRLGIFGLLALILTIAFTGCNRIVIDEYQGMALTTHTWQVEYFISRNEKTPRIEEFASNSLLNIDGERPPQAFGDKDDRELWWADIPPKPTLDEIEALEKTGEKHSRPSLLRTVEFSLQYQYQGETFEKPTDFSVYRQAVKAKRQEKSLKILLGIGDRWVQKAEAINGN